MLIIKMYHPITPCQSRLYPPLSGTKNLASVLCVVCYEGGGGVYVSVNKSAITEVLASYFSLDLKKT